MYTPSNSHLTLSPQARLPNKKHLLIFPLPQKPGRGKRGGIFVIKILLGFLIIIGLLPQKTYAQILSNRPKTTQINNKTLKKIPFPQSGVASLLSFPPQIIQNTAQTPPSENGGSAPTLSPVPVTPGIEPFQPEKIPLRPSARQQDRQRYVSSPGTTIVTPSGYGKSWGSAGIGIGFQGRTRFTEQSDGAIGLSAGFGNPQKTVGFDVGVSIFNLNDGFADRGSISLKLHRSFPENWAVAIGWQNALVWGESDAGTSLYAVTSKMFKLKENTNQAFSQLYLSAGIGTGQYRTETQIQDDIETIGVFGSAALRVAEPVNLIAEWTGQDLNLGVSIVPFPEIPLVITPALADVTNNAGDGARFVLGIGYGFSFK
ncbi:hypothetical protein NG798_04290 [Ancylothrix sp. C2]|uniref:hypothetical protein n=1 Tax=Ancylothrix sp. D3o TaxID=2953691 RepID=UPI0021BAD417|nr:hypothetical protein [Ancylothrix sp. D3o]MCT7948998.1 hypothetical protein [Ancylothrix sp. D3o]